MVSICPLLYTVKPQNLNFFPDEAKTIIKAKITKSLHAFENYTPIYNVQVMNSFNTELQLKRTESMIKNKLKNVLNELQCLRLL